MSLAACPFRNASSAGAVVAPRAYCGACVCGVRGCQKESSDVAKKQTSTANLFLTSWTLLRHAAFSSFSGPPPSPGPLGGALVLQPPHRPPSTAVGGEGRRRARLPGSASNVFRVSVSIWKSIQHSIDRSMPIPAIIYTYNTYVRKRCGRCRTPLVGGQMKAAPVVEASRSSNSPNVKTAGLMAGRPL